MRLFNAAYSEVGLQGGIYGTDINNLCPAYNQYNTTLLVPPFRCEREYVDKLLNICTVHKIDAIYPLIDPDILIISGYNNEFVQVGTTPMTLKTDAATICDDKWLTYQFFKGEEIPTAESWLPTPDGQPPTDLDPLGMYFIKPRRGSGAKDAYPVKGKDLPTFISRVEAPIIQECLTGPEENDGTEIEITCDVVCDMKGAAQAVVCRARIEIRAGEVQRGRVIHDQQLIDICVKIANKLPGVGMFSVQCIRDSNGAPRFTEINARFGGGCPVTVQAGVNFPAYYLALAGGIEYQLPPLGKYDTDLLFTRHDETTYIRATDYREYSR